MPLLFTRGTFDPAHDETYNKTCVTNKDSDQPVHSSSMERILVYPSLNSQEAVEDTCDRRRLIRLRGCLWVFAGRKHLIVGFSSTGSLARLHKVQEELLHYPPPPPPPALASASALPSVSTFTLRFFNGLYFPDHLIDLVHIWYDDIVPKFYSAIPKPITSRSRSGQDHGQKFLMLKLF